MSIRVDLGALGAALGQHDTAYLLTAGDPRPHVAEVFPVLADGLIRLAEPGRTARRVVVEQPSVTLLLPPRKQGGYTLIVDGDASLEGTGALHLAPTSAVLHRAASWASDDIDSACGSDCRPLDG